MADLKVLVEEAYRINVYLDTNILIDYVENKFPLLNQSIDYLSKNPFVNLRSSHFVLFEFTEIRKAMLFWKNVDPLESSPFDNRVKSEIKKEWKYKNVDYSVYKDEITQTVLAELEKFKTDLGLNFDEHVLHEELVYPTSSLCLATKISREDCLVMVSCMYPNENLKLDHCLLLTRDAQYFKAVQENVNEVQQVFEDNELNTPVLIRTQNLQDDSSGVKYNLYDNNNPQANIEQFWVHLILNTIKQKLPTLYLGKTYNYGTKGVAANCIYFELDGANTMLQDSTGLLFIRNDLSSCNIIAGPFEYWNNGNKINLPHSNPEFPRYSFLKEKIAPQLLSKLREEGNLVFYNYD